MMTVDFSSKRSFSLITIFVVFIHLAFAIFFTIYSEVIPEKIKPKQKFVVKTIKLQTTVQKKTTESAPSGNEPIAQTELKHEPQKESVLPESKASPKIEKLPQSTIKPEIKTEIKIDPKKEVKVPPTIKSTVKNPTPSVKPKPVEPKKVEPKKIEIKKPEVKSSPSKPATQPAKVEQKPKNTSQREQVLNQLKALESNLAKIDNQKPSKTHSGTASSSFDEMKLPAKMGTLAIDNLTIDDPGSGLSVKERNYRDEVISLLKLRLKLPEAGLVNVEITLARTGKVLKIDILKSKSSRNSEHLKKALSSFNFPSFGDNFEHEASHIFPITFLSE